MTADPRLTPARPDLAAAHLKGTVEAERFVEPVPHVVGVPVAPMAGRPDGTAAMGTQLLFGERVEVYEAEGQWAWGQAVADGYVGYVPRPCLERAEGAPAPTHRIAPPMSHLYPIPDMKRPPECWLSGASRVAVSGTAEAGFLPLASGGWVPEAHLAALDAPATDWVAEAERFLGLPYLWGGRSGMGVDCSGLVQLALAAAGRDCPRDSDLQEARLGRDLAAETPLMRGDLVFWKGHVGVMTDGATLLHANAHHMAVVAEPLDTATGRIAGAGGGGVTRRARLA